MSNARTPAPATSRFQPAGTSSVPTGRLRRIATARQIPSGDPANTPDSSFAVRYNPRSHAMSVTVSTFLDTACTAPRKTSSPASPSSRTASPRARLSFGK